MGLYRGLLTSSIASLAGKLIPTNEDKIVFYSTPDLQDNTLYVFKYYYRHHRHDKELVWVIRDEKIGHFIKREFPEVRVVKAFTLSATKELAEAKIVFESDLLPFSPSKNQVIFQLWHGLPGKKTGYAHPKRIKDFYIYFNRWLTHFSTTSEIVTSAYITQFRIDYEKFVMTGLPRNDALMTTSRKKAISLLEDILNTDLSRYSSVILYTPTYRFNSFDFDYNANVMLLQGLLKSKKMLQFLRENNIALLIKPHKIVLREVKRLRNQEPPGVFFLENSMFIRRKAYINEIFPAVDLLITDFSSIYFDYLLTNKPVVFYVPDYKDLAIRSGFLLDYNVFAPGDKSHNIASLINSIKRNLQDDPHEEWRGFVKRAVFNVGDDGDSTQRVVKYVRKVAS